MPTVRHGIGKIGGKALYAANLSDVVTIYSNFQ
jgi:hypothetical protein